MSDRCLRDLQLVELDLLKEFLRICEKYHLRYYALGGTLLGAVRHKGFIPWDDDVDVGMPRPDFIRFEQIIEKELPEYFQYESFGRTPGYTHYVPRLTDSRVKVLDGSAAVEREKNAWIDIFPLDGMPGEKYRRDFHCFRLLTARVRVNYSLFSTNINLKKSDRPFYEKLLILAGGFLPVEKIFNTEKELKKLDRLMQKYPYDSSPYLINFMGVHKLKEMFHKKYYGKGAVYDFEDVRLNGPSEYDFVLRQMYGKYWMPPSAEEMNHHNIRIVQPVKTSGVSWEYSVLMAVYGRERPEHLKASIESMIRQTLPPADFVLVCDGPLPPKLQLIVEWAAQELGRKFQCVRLAEHRGLGCALKIGLNYCRCSVVARMDSDDISRPDRCRLQMEKMNSGDYAIVGGSVQEFVRTPGDTGKLRILPENPEQITAFAKKRNPFNHPCVMYRKEAVQKAGSYQDFPGFEDYYLWVRMLKDGCAAWNLQEVILDMRTGNGMYGRRGGKEYLMWGLRFQNYLRRERFISFGQFLENCLIRSAVGVAPSGMREKFYRVFLRKKVKKAGETEKWAG